MVAKKSAAKKLFDPNAAAAPGSGVFGLPNSAEYAKDALVHLVPVPWGVTCSYGGGTENGPRAIYEASKQVDLYDASFGKPYEAGIFMQPPSPLTKMKHDKMRPLAERIIKAGGDVSHNRKLQAALSEVHIACAEMNEWVYRMVRGLLAKGKIVGVIGGDHSVPFGAIRAYAEKYTELTILHIDAHADLREAYEGFVYSHASIMYNVCQTFPNVRIVQVGIRDFCEEELEYARSQNGRVSMFKDDELANSKFVGEPWIKICRNILEHFVGPVYVSFDIDGLDPTLCPHTGTPVPGGLSFQEVVALLRLVADNHYIIGFDVNEVAPDPTGKSEWDATVGARAVYKAIGACLDSLKNK